MASDLKCACGAIARYKLVWFVPSNVGIARKTSNRYCHRCADRAAWAILAYNTGARWIRAIPLERVA